MYKIGFHITPRQGQCDLGLSHFLISRGYSWEEKDGLWYNTESATFWSQDPFILFKITENPKDTFLNGYLPIFAMLEIKTEKFKIFNSFKIRNPLNFNINILVNNNFSKQSQIAEKNWHCITVLQISLLYGFVDDKLFLISACLLSLL